MNQQLVTEITASLSEKLGEKVQLKSNRSMGGGCIHNATLIETTAGNFFVKWNEYAPGDIFLREAESLTELKKAVEGELVVPSVLVAKSIGQTPGFLVLEYLQEGRCGNDEEMLGRGLAKLHSFKAEMFGFHQNNYCGETLQDNKWKTKWCDFFIENRLLSLLNLIKEKRNLSSAELSIFDRLLGRIPKLLPETLSPVLIHGDLWSGNYMLTLSGPALIDPACYYADREMEFGIITMFGGFSQRFFAAYSEINPLPGDWQDRNLLYQLYHVLNHFLLFGGGYGQNALQIARKYC
ncbi:MAG: hypothetical protein CSA36_07940 [Draconibacterium sp.]|nr:MAG: hypothetical protein CSA36_07940 [Draconibacterium sp.]